jgi:hypothetical protein
MATLKNGAAPELLIDLHGIHAALTTKKNKIRNDVIGAIEGGRMKIVRSVSDELKDLYPDVYENFKCIKGKKYVQATMQSMSLSTSLMESYGGSLFGMLPRREVFDAVGMALREKLILVSANKGYADGSKIAKKCELNGVIVNVLDM